MPARRVPARPPTADTGTGAVDRWAATGVAATDYDDRFARLAAAGHDIHGEANFVSTFRPRTVLDAGCGTGRVAIELARRGCAVAGIDRDRAMLQQAVEKAPTLEWYAGDICGMDLRGSDGEGRCFDLVIAAGNVMIFLEPGSERRALAAMARHLVDGGVVVLGFQLRPAGYGVEDLDADARSVGLVALERYSTWARDRWTTDSRYIVAVFRRPRPAGPGSGGGLVR